MIYSDIFINHSYVISIVSLNLDPPSPVQGCKYEKIYAQTGPSHFAKNGCTLDSCNVFVDSENFINFDDVKDFSSFDFALRWDGQKTLKWTQNENPLSQTRKRS